MDWWGYSWEAIEITTDDSYILTTFHIKENKNNKKARDPSLHPIVMMNGSNCDATSWFWSWDDVPMPLPLQLFERGFDIYLAANRGT